MISRLSDGFAISGCEDTVRDIILSQLNNDLFSVKCDKIGNIIAEHKNTEGKPSVLLVAHMDECGLLVNDITEDGYLRFDIIGDIKVSSLVSKRVKNDDVNGVISIKAVHLSKKDEKDKELTAKDLYIDIGAKTEAEAKKYISVGDYFTFSNKFKHLGDDIIIGKALSRSVACYTLIDFINNFKGGDVNLICVFTALKEVRNRGLKTALNSLENIKYACVIDSVDTKDSNVSLKNGAVVGLMSDMTKASEVLRDKLLKVSDNIQYEYIKDKTEYDEIDADIPSVFIGFPCENKGANINTVSLSDTEELKKLLSAFVQEVAL